MRTLILINLIFAASAYESHNFGYGNLFDPKDCSLDDELVKEIQGYAPTVETIIEAVTKGEFRGTTYNRLADFVDAFGGRFTGTATLEESIDYMLNKSEEFHFQNVHGEDVSFQNWIRGEESAEMVEPRLQKLHMISVSRSAGTDGKEVKAEVVVLESLDELYNKSKVVKGKIAIFNLEYKDLLSQVHILGNEFYEAQKFGAVAVLTKSVASISLNIPHTSQVSQPLYVPCGFISVEDAMMLSRIKKRKQKIVIALKFEARMGEEVTSRNVVADLVGTEIPEKVVIISGHIDSYDAGTGALDDGAGLFLSWNSAAILKALGLIPKRTLRFVGWSVEEYGLFGAMQYLHDHSNETKNIDMAMESDFGVFNPLGLDFGGSKKAACIMHEIIQLFEPLNATQLHVAIEVGSDVSLFAHHSIPALELRSENNKYFRYHHSEADTMESLNSTEMDRATALWAATAYVVANLSQALPRK